MTAEAETHDIAGSVAASRLDMIRRCWRKVSFLVPWLLALIFTAAIGVVAANHEMWRDEIQAWLLARDSASPWQLLYNMRYEGHPGLWHLILWPVAHITRNPEAMQVVHVFIAGASAFVMLRFSPFPLIVRLLIICGYFFVYEWAVISRNYAISVLLLFSICALFEHRWKRFPYIAGLFFLLCHTNIHSIIITIVLTVLLMIEFAVAYAAHARGADRYLGRVAIGLIIILLGLGTGIKQTAPPEDSGFAEAWYYRWTQERLESTASRVIRAHLPVPPDRHGFWNSNRFLLPGKKMASRVSAPLIPRERWTRYGISLLLVLAIPFFKRPWPGVAYICISLGLLSFFYIKHPGSMRHHGFLYLSLVCAAWMSYYYKPWRLPWGRGESVLLFLDRFRIAAFIPIFIVQIWGAYVAVKHEWTSTFSSAKSAAEWLKAEFPDKESVVYAGVSGPLVSPVVGYLEAESFYYLDAGRFASYVTWDKKRRTRRNKKQNRAQLVELAEAEGKKLVLLTSSKIGKRYQGLESKELAQFGGGMIGGENYFVYLLQ